jgi:hypothetical protein
MTAMLAALAMVFAALGSDASAQTRHPRQDGSPWSTPRDEAKSAGKPQPCRQYGEGFYRLPGSDTCIKLGGSVRTDVTVTPGR